MISYTKSLELDPFMWCSFEKVCKINPSNIDLKKLYSEQNNKFLRYKTNTPPPQNRDFSLSPEGQPINNINMTHHYQNSQFSINNNKINSNLDRSSNNPFINIIPDKNKNFEKTNTLQKGIQQIQEECSSSDVLNNNSLNFNFLKTNIYNNQINSSSAYNFQTTPVVAKEKDSNEYNLAPNIKNRDNNNLAYKFLSSSSNISPHNLNFNNNFTSDSMEQSNFDVKHKLADTSLIKPFTINSNSILSREMTPNLQKVFNPSSNRQDRGDNLVNNFIQTDTGGLQSNKNMFSNIQLLGKSLNNSTTNIKSHNNSLINFKDYALINFKSNNNVNVFFSDICHLLRVFAEILLNFNLYNCKEAIETIKSLPKHHYLTGYCLTLLGRCYFELSKYKEAERYFQESFKLEPYRLEGLEYYSSCLWHLQDHYKLCHLANEALEQSYFSPETWIVFGNCYSLQKEHEIALKFFNRAIQLNPSFSYAYTLSAHEYTETEAFNQAKNFYKDAIAYDDR